MAAKGIQEVPDVIQAKKFEVVNDSGKVIVEMSNLQGGGVDNGQLVTRTSTGGTLVKLIAGPGGGAVETRNGKGQILVELGVTTDGQGHVETQNGKGQRLVALSATTDGEGLVKTQNGKGQTLVRLTATTGGEGVVVTKNGNGGTLVELGVTMGGNGLVETYNGKGVVTSRSP